MSRFSFSPQHVESYNLDGFNSETIRSSTTITHRSSTTRRTGAEFSEVFITSSNMDPLTLPDEITISTNSSGHSPWTSTHASISVTGGGVPVKHIVASTSENDSVEVRSYWAAEGVASPDAGNLVSPRKVTRFPSFAHRKLRVGSHHPTSLLNFDVDMGMPSPCTAGTVVEETVYTSSMPGGGSHHRRESFLYRNREGSEFHDVSGGSTHSSRHDSSDTIKEDQNSEDVIVTPFAQILHTLKRVCGNYVLLTNIPASKSKKYAASCNGNKPPNIKLSEEQHEKLALETLHDLEWSLEQLETIQTHRSVGELATNKFKRMLSKELNHFAEANKSGSQISDYICSTFFEKQSDLDLTKYKVSHEVSTSIHSDQSGTAVRSTEPLQGLHPVVKAVDAMVILPADPGLREQMLTISGIKNDAATASHFPDHSSKYGVSVTDEGAVDEMLAGVDKWGVDVFHMSELTNKRPLTCIGYRIFKDRNLMSEFHIPDRTLVNYLACIEDHYRSDVQYHNSLHAADVLQSCHSLLSISVLQEVFTSLEILAIIFGAAVHDVDHPGVTNQYLINSGSDLAIMYNDASVLENHHLALAFKLLQNEDCDIFANLPSKSRQTFRRMTIDVVLATDMSKHMSMLADLKTMVETKAVAGSGILQLDNYNDRIVVLQNMVHCSDLSNPTKPLHLYEQWIERIMEEFFRQGDLEREQGLDISPMCDRTTANIEKSQIGFIDYIVHPIWETWGDLVYPDCQDILDTLEYNRNWFQNIIRGTKMPTVKEQKRAATSTAAPQTTAPVQEKPESQPVKITEKEQSSGDAVVEKKDSSTDHPKEINSQPANRLKRHRGGASPIRCNPLSTAARPYAVRGTLTVPSSNPADDVQS